MINHGDLLRLPLLVEEVLRPLFLATEVLKPHIILVKGPLNLALLVMVPFSLNQPVNFLIVG